VKKANPGAGFGELGKLLGQKWATMTDKVRHFYFAPVFVFSLVTIFVFMTFLNPQDKEKYVKQSEAKKAAL